MLSLSTWRRRISNAWRKKMGRKRDHVKEVVQRFQEGWLVTLYLRTNSHDWLIQRRDWQAYPTDIVVSVRVDRALDQIELFRWLAKTLPVE